MYCILWRMCVPITEFRGWYVQASMELGPEDVSLLERCSHFRGWYVQASMELGPKDVSLLERCSYFRGWYYHLGSGEWQKIEAVSGNPPSPRTLHSSTSMWRDKLVVFSGGDSGTDAVDNTIHLFDIGEVRERGEGEREGENRRQIYSLFEAEVS